RERVDPPVEQGVELEFRDMAAAAQRDQVAPGERPWDVARRREVGQPGRAPGRAERARVDAVEADRARPAADSGERVQQAGLAAAIGPDQADQLAFGDR